MLDPQASRFWQATLLSGLMDVEGLTACWNAIPPGKRDFPEHIDRRLARQAFLSNALTLWQAQQLLAGRTGGFKVDRYVLLDLIGQGGMGRVYLARDTRLNRRVALKILAPERINNPRAIARFQREARVGAQLQHENLVRVYDFGESNGRYFLVMEYIEGKTIGTLISEQGPMPPATAVQLVRQVAMGLGHAHRKGLIHRDVNPYNILVTHDGTAKLADLGLAIDIADADRVTREGATVGTFDYVAPEQARHSHAADIRSDIYSLGCTLYHMLAGQVPFPSPSLPEKLFAHQALEPTPLGQLVPGLPEGLVEIVRKMIRKSPDERYATPIQVVQALESYTDEHAGVGSRADLARSFPRPEAEPSPQPEESRGPARASSPIVESPVSTSARSDEARAVAVPQTAAEPASTSLKPVAVPAGSSPVPVAATQSGSSSASGAGTDATEPAIPLLTPVDDPAERGPEVPVPLYLDFGPDPPLSERIGRSKSPFAALFSLGSRSVFASGGSGSDTSTSTSEGLASWPASGWLWGLVVLAALAATLIVLLALAGALRPIPVRPPEQDTQSKAKSPQNLGAANGHPQRIQADEPAIIVRTGSHNQNESEKEFPANRLLEAMHVAMGSDGWVELKSRKPMRLAGPPFDFTSAKGWLRVRAAPGTVLEIELRAGNPFLATGSALRLILSGLEIRVRYPRTSGNPPDAQPAVIMAAGPIQLDRCAFQVADGPRSVDACALAIDGSDLTVDRCWFQGFDKAIKVLAYNRTVAWIRQTMIVPGSGRAAARLLAPDSHGWGVEVQLMPGGKDSQRRLVLEHCTVEGAGFLDLAGDSAQSPLRVEVKRCAVRTEALLACKSAKPEDHLSTQVEWQGEGNQLEILGHSWIVLSASLGTPAFSAAVTDLESWSKVVARESEPIRSKLLYRTNPAARSNPLRPQHFGIDAPDSSTAKVGANPEQVGPWSR